MGQLRGGAVFAGSVVRVSCGAGKTGSEPRIKEAASAQLLPGRGVAVWFVSVRPAGYLSSGMSVLRWASCAEVPCLRVVSSESVVAQAYRRGCRRSTVARTRGGRMVRVS